MSGDEDKLLRSVALQNANTILLARQRAEQELLRAKEALERKTDELARSLALVRATLESTTDGILVTDGAGHVTSFNQKYLAMWRLPTHIPARRDESGPAIAAPAAPAMPAMPVITHHRDLMELCARQVADKGRFLQRVEEIYASSPAESFDLIELVDGRFFERFSRVQLIDERNVGRVWSFRDITERKRAEAALRDETRILELLNRTGIAIGSTLEVQPLLQLVTDATTQLSGARFGAFFYNFTDERGEVFQLYTLSGAPREAFEKFGHPRATALFGPTFRGEGIIRIADVLKDPRYGRSAPHHGMPPGHLPVRSYLAVPVISRAGTPLGGLFFGHPDVGVFTERTERVIAGIATSAAVAIDNARLYDDARRAAEERKLLLDAERAARAEAERVSVLKDEFLATVSHELRTPLNAILGWSQILQARRTQDEELAEGLEVIARNSRIQTQLIEDLLDMSRIISGKVRLDVQRVDLADVVKAAVASVQHSADAREIELGVNVDPQAGPVRGDPSRLQQCLWNLLSNSIKFTPRGGRVRLTVQRVENAVEIAVADNGQGIRADFLPHVFERFRQGDATTTRHHGGLGLGLSIVKNLVELHGGTVSAGSAGEGRGALFRITLPLMAVSTPGASDPAGPILTTLHDSMLDYPSLEGVTVLVIDDEPDARTLLQRVLEECGARVLSAASAAEGLEIVRTQRPTMIVSDIGMPGEDGYAFIRRVRELAPGEGGRTPAAALTAFARPEDRTRALRAGYQSHILKPVEPLELAAVVASLTGGAPSDRRVSPIPHS